MRTRLSALATVAALATLAVVGAATPASAHATLVSVTPSPGTTLTTAPTQVTLRFDENVQTASKIVVDGPSGRRVDHGGTTAVDDRVRVAIHVEPRPAYVGAYRVAYRVISADGHPVSGEATFRYAPPGVQAATTSAAEEAQPRSGSHLWWIIGGVVVVLAAGALLLVPRRRGGRR